MDIDRKINQVVNYKIKWLVIYVIALIQLLNALILSVAMQLMVGAVNDLYSDFGASLPPLTSFLTNGGGIIIAIALVSLAVMNIYLVLFRKQIINKYLNKYLIISVVSFFLVGLLTALVALSIYSPIYEINTY